MALFSSDILKHITDTILNKSNGEIADRSPDAFHKPVSFKLS